MYKAYKVRSVTIPEECHDQPSHSNDSQREGGACAGMNACFVVVANIVIYIFDSVYTIPDKLGLWTDNATHPQSGQLPWTSVLA